MTLGEALSSCQPLPATEHPVGQTLSRELAATFGSGGGPVIRIELTGDAAGPRQGWFGFDGTQAVLSATTPATLYSTFARLRDAWQYEPADGFAEPRRMAPAFQWLAGRDELLTGRYGFLVNRQRPVGPDDIDAAMRELARIGCTHVVINELARRSAETGPDGEIYYRFYDYTPDIDQYVDTPLNEGTYPKEYLGANLARLQQIAAAAERYGLIPGLYSAHPRSVPESLLARWPHLRGARIDHPFRSFLPRYTLSVAHPAVRWHYAQLIQRLLREVPQLGFVKMLLNDSGSGFEFTASLYPGRNGGQYIVREWRPDSEIAQLAAENVIRYYRMLRDAARQVNPDFQLMTGLKNIAEEQTPILAGMDTGINLQTQSQRSDVPDEEWQQTRNGLTSRGAHVLTDTNAFGSPYVLGVPAPFWSADRLREQLDAGYDRIDAYLNTVYLAPWDPNREIVSAFAAGSDVDAEAVVADAARRWVGDDADALVDVWRTVDGAARQAPLHFLYGGLGFTWYRWWIRPFVPNLSAIPEAERAYYEEPMLTVFNNPHNIDFAADMLWSLQSLEQADAAVATYDEAVIPAVDRALTAATSRAESGHEVWVDLRDRLQAYRCYVETMRNLSSWISGVHGFMDAGDDATRQRRREQVQSLVSRERANVEALLRLWETSTVDFMPVQETGESVHNYGANFGGLLRRKIDLMDRYGDGDPHIDPDYMFRAPEGFPVDEAEYLKY